MHNSSYLRNAVILGLVTAIGPFGIDLYLPALPAIGTGLQADADVVTLSLTAYFIAFGLFQMVFGTVSDVYGRKLPLYLGIGLFVVAGIGCALATDIKTLIALRFLQGVGGAAGIIVPRAIVRDLYSGVEEVKMMSMLMLVFSVSPLLAPLAGSFVVADFGWRGVFWAITLLGIAGFALLTVFVQETLPRERRIKADIGSLKSAVKMLLGDREFVGMTLIQTFAVVGFFLYLGHSAFILTDHYGFTPREYSLAFSANALAFFAAAQLNGYLGKRFGMRATLLPAAIGFALFTTMLAVLFALGFDSFWLMASLLFVGFSFVGILMPTLMVLALEHHGDIAGTAASLMNTSQLLIGAAAIGLSGPLMNGTPTPMLVCIAICALLSLLATFITFRKAA